MTINQMRYFRELAHTEHYGRAAEALYIAQPTLSRAIALLEEELEVELFEKQGRNIALTQAGQVFLSYVEQSLSMLEQGVAAMRQFSQHTETLSIGCITPFLGKNPFYSYLLEHFSKNRCRLDIHVSQTENLLGDLKRRRCELAFCSFAPAEKDVAFVPVLELPFVVAMPAGDPLTVCEAVEPEQLRDRALVFNAEPVYSSLIQRIFDYYHITTIVRGSSNEDSVLLRMVADGMGLLISTDHPQMHTDGTVLRSLRQEVFHRYIYLAYLPDAPHTSAASEVISFAKEHALKEEGLQPKACDRA